jgi:hypothetical protein
MTTPYVKIGCCLCYAAFAYMGLRHAILPDLQADSPIDTQLKDIIDRHAKELGIQKTVMVVQRTPFYIYGTRSLPGKAGIFVAQGSLKPDSPEWDERTMRIVHRLFHLKHNDSLWGHLLPLTAAAATTFFANYYVPKAIGWGLGFAAGLIVMIRIGRRSEIKAEAGAIEHCGAKVVRNAVTALKGQAKCRVTLHGNPSWGDIRALIGYKVKRTFKWLNPTWWMGLTRNERIKMMEAYLEKMPATLGDPMAEEALVESATPDGSTDIDSLLRMEAALVKSEIPDGSTDTVALVKAKTGTQKGVRFTAES